MINEKNLRRAKYIYELSKDVDIKIWTQIQGDSNTSNGEVIGRSDRFNFYANHPKLNNCFEYHKIDGTIWWDFSNSMWFGLSTDKIDNINDISDRNEALNLLLKNVE